MVTNLMLLPLDRLDLVRIGYGSHDLKSFYREIHFVTPFFSFRGALG